ncbi:hypothetical protein PVAND_004097 [Polypedilum vanderplanki]|uniref:Uncharacterized protein n=1 Tax=Polypedilum vanderplanki TaxID=319348 RepID=A0A9J6BWP2_POLVA|nr:hypothetical protein PVAND_004097 [Polypedilum vanderplanki]
MKSIKGYIEERLKYFRESMAQAVVEDLLKNAFKCLFERSNSEIDKCHLEKASNVIHCDEMANNRKACIVADDVVHPFPMKSFSLV